MDGITAQEISEIVCYLNKHGPVCIPCGPIVTLDMQAVKAAMKGKREMAKFVKRLKDKRKPQPKVPAKAPKRPLDKPGSGVRG